MCGYDNIYVHGKTYAIALRVLIIISSIATKPIFANNIFASIFIRSK